MTNDDGLEREFVFSRGCSLQSADQVLNFIVIAQGKEDEFPPAGETDEDEGSIEVRTALKDVLAQSADADAAMRMRRSPYFLHSRNRLSDRLALPF